MKYGNFYSKKNIYEFDGRYYTPRWCANAIQNRDWLQIYNTCIEGYDAKSPEPANWPKSVLVCCNLDYSGLNLWDQIAKSYSGLYAQSQLHYYDAEIAAGQIPDWATPWYQSGTLLIHEYQPGKVAWVREGNFDNDIYIFMKDCDPPDESDPDVEEPQVITSSGALIPMNSKISIEWDVLYGKVIPVSITITPIE